MLFFSSICPETFSYVVEEMTTPAPRSITCPRCASCAARSGSIIRRPSSTSRWQTGAPDWLVTEGEPFDDVLDVSQLGVPDWYRWSFTHNIVELATAIKPFALAKLLDLPNCGNVVYFDPDIVLFFGVDDILATLEHSSIALTPHQNKPERTLEAILDNEVASLKHGIFNLGFIGVANCDEGKRFAHWWGERTYELCRADVPNGLFTDQKWVNFAPCSSRTWRSSSRRGTTSPAPGT